MRTGIKGVNNLGNKIIYRSKSAIAGGGGVRLVKVYGVGEQLAQILIERHLTIHREGEAHITDNGGSISVVIVSKSREIYIDYIPEKERLLIFTDFEPDPDK